MCGYILFRVPVVKQNYRNCIVLHLICLQSSLVKINLIRRQFVIIIMQGNSLLTMVSNCFISVLHLAVVGTDNFCLSSLVFQWIHSDSLCKKN